MQKRAAPTGTDSRSARPRERPLYIGVAGEIERQIRAGTLRVGERVPSIRAIKHRWKVSTSTALQAYFWLENRGLIEARPRSGFYARVPFADLAPEPGFEPQRSVPRDAGLDARLGQLLQLRAAAGALQLGAAVPTPDFYPVRKLNQTIRQIIRENPAHSCGYEFPPGHAELRRQIAKHSPRQIGKSSWEEIIVTVGAMEGINLCLRAIAKAGDVIAVESPTFFGILQLIQSLGMRALEIPTDPRTGMDLNALEHALRRKRVRACLIIGNCHNPLGYVLSDDVKSHLAELSGRYKVPIIEDDLFGDVAFEEPRPHTIKYYDREGLVLLVSSFCKVLGPGFRIGWVHAGRWQSTVEQLQFLNTVAAPSLPQQVLARFLESGGYERHLRRVRLLLADRLHMVSRAIAQYFPPGTGVTRPKGGFLLWVQMPKSVDSITVFDKALQHKIGVVPGPMFSTTGQYRNCLRLSCGTPWSERLEDSIAMLGSIVGRLVSGNGRGTAAALATP
ncbi:MAG TPA: PLP-dependent aminotransferase family protein [Candidatus Sulfotelmatobacter sp.]|nr:PLP-dependent aminotransferase family protein [Candidatus Sulfotelmatobacter sp.]